jgi:hypothetical protein
MWKFEKMGKTHILWVPEYLYSGCISKLFLDLTFMDLIFNLIGRELDCERATRVQFSDNAGHIRCD